ncbi:hypothetical protein D3C71_903420 [compost metagenome]
MALIGKKQKGTRQLHAAHFQRTVMEIVLQHGGDIIVKIAEGFHQPGNGGVPRRVFKLRTRHVGVVTQIGYTAQLTHNLQHSLARRTETALQHIAHHQRAGVDERITRFALFDFQLEQRVKRLTRGIFPDPLPDLVFIILTHRRHQTQQFGDRLNRKTLSGIPRLIKLPLNGTNRDTQFIAADTRQRGNVIGNVTLPQ